MGNEEHIGIALLVHEFLGYFLQLLQYRNPDGIGHHVGELIPNNEQTIISSQLCQTILYLSEPLFDIVIVQADVKLGFSQSIGHSVEDTKIACL